MKSSRRFLLVSVVLSISILWFPSLRPAAEAFVYNGDVCWKLNDYTVGKNLTMRLDVSEMGPGHFQLNGIVIGDGGQVPASGNAEIIGNQMAVQLLYSAVGRGEIIKGTSCYGS